MEATIFQHFRKEEQTFIKQVIGWIERSQQYFSPVLTNFLNPRQQFIVEALVHRYDEIFFSFEGGYESAEQKRCLIYPKYFSPTDEDFEVTAFLVEYPQKFVTMEHRKILGSLMGMGINRDLIGDIISDGENWQFFCAKEMEAYIQQQLNRVGRDAIQLRKISKKQHLTPLNKWTLSSVLVSSLRVDVIIAAALKISRQRAKMLIERNQVKVNWVDEIKTAFLVELLDIISIRGYGRIQIRKIESRTKKNKIRLEIGLLKKEN